MSTLVLTDPLFLRHDPGPAHPESPARLRAILDELARRPVVGAKQGIPRPATDQEICAVHAEPYWRTLAATSGRPIELDPDTTTSIDSVAAARLGAGAAVGAVEAVWEGRAGNALVLPRPPGHHAETSRAMGFCLLNNVAIAAEAARRMGARRVMIVDWDVHHGNGTQHHFAARRDVLFASCHQFPFYPGTGAAAEIGEGEGAGYTVNCALPAGQTDADYGAVFDDLFLPIGEAFAPDLILVSAGFDPHERDPLADMRATERGFAAMTTALAALADRVCGGKLVLVLEGGYDLGALASSVHACLEVLAGQRRDQFPAGVGAAGAAVAATRAALGQLWRLP